jgi:hypothetical protein
MYSTYKNHIRDRNMHFRLKILCFTLLLCFIPHLQAALPKAFHASYSVEKSGLALGTMQSSLKYKGKHYSYHKMTKATGLAALLSGDVLLENSDGDIKSGHLISKRYLRHHKSKKKNKKDQFYFKNRNTVKGLYNTKSYSLTVPPKTIDPTLLELHLMQNFSENRRQRHYNVVDRGQLKQYTFQNLGIVTLKLTQQTYVCEKVRISRKNSNTQTTLWLAKKLNYFPVRIQHNDDGDILEAKLTSYRTP